MKQIASFFLAVLVLMAGVMLPAPTVVRAAEDPAWTIDPSGMDDTPWPASITLKPGSVTPVNGEYFFKAGETFSLLVGFKVTYDDGNHVFDSNATCLQESTIEGELDGQSKLLIIPEDPYNDSNFKPEFFYTVQPTDATGLLVVKNGVNHCGEGDRLWNSNTNSKMMDGSSPSNELYFQHLYPYKIYIDNSAPEIAYGGVELGGYKKARSIKMTVTDTPKKEAAKAYAKWSTSSATPADLENESNLLPIEQEVNYPDPGASGTYYLHVKATDAAGHVTSHVMGPYPYDIDAPTVSMTPNSGSAQASHTVSYSISDAHSGVDLSTKKPTYQWFLDGGAVDEAKVLTASSGTLTTPTDIEGTYKLRITATDLAGNTTTVDSGNYIVDKTAPSITFNSEGNGTPAAARQVIVTMTEAAGTLGAAFYNWSTSASAPADSDSGWQQLFDGSGSKKSHTATVNSPSNMTGSYYLHVKATDNSGNKGTKSSTSSFVLDNTKPDFTFTNPATASYSQSASTGFNIKDPDTVSDKTAYLVKYLIDTNPTSDQNDGAWASTPASGAITIDNRTGIFYLHAKVYDQAGNWVYKDAGPYYLDNTKPTGTIAPAQTHTKESSLTVNLTAADDNKPTSVKTTVDQMRFMVDGGSWTGWESYGSTKQISTASLTQGSHKVYVQFMDSAGNISSTYETNFIYDTTPPAAGAITYSPSARTNQNVTATLPVTDNFSSAADIVETTQGKFTYTFTSNGTYQFQFRDQAGNTATATATVNWIDKTAPAVTFSDEGTLRRQKSVSSTISATDNVSAGDKLTYEYAWSKSSSIQPTTWNPAPPDRTVTLADTDGSWFLWARVTDEVGNRTVVSTSSAKPFKLDNTAPTATISYSPAGRTAGKVKAELHLVKDADETVLITKPDNGLPEYEFSDNGTFEFEFIDEAGNTGKALATVTNIDRTAPSANITYNPSGYTNQPVEVTIDGGPSRGVSQIQAPADAELVSQTVTKAVYMLPTNGVIRYLVTDLDTGMTQEGEAEVTKIDKEAPTAELSYDITEQTNRNVTVTLEASDPPRDAVTVLNNDGSFQYTFTENGTFTFQFRDDAGNLAEKTATVNYIDKEVPQPKFILSETDWTKNDVTVTFATYNTEKYPVIVTDADGNVYNQYTFTANGSKEFTFTDAAGNKAKATVTVSNIDREAPKAELIYSERGWTNRNVTVTVSPADASPVTVVNNNGSSAYTFSDNGTFTFVLRDAAGNEAQYTAVVDRIDKTVPTATIEYSTSQATRADVRVRVAANEPITVIGNDGNTFYDFTSNGSYTFRIKDRAGNETSVPASVNYIDRTPPVLSLEYSTTASTKSDVVVKLKASEPMQILNNNRSDQYVFRENGKFKFYVQDLAGNTAEIEAVVNNIDKSTAKVNYKYSETAPTKNNVTVKLEADRALTYTGISGNTVTFTENGTRWLEATDALGNVYVLKVTVGNIDREAPKLRFLNGDDLLLQIGSAVTPAADVEATDNIDGNVNNKLTVTHNIQTQQPGTYTITYRVTDAAGNTAVVTRKAVVVAPTSFSAYVNSKAAGEDDLLVYGNKLQVQLFGDQGNNAVKWLRGYKSMGDFKKVRSLIPSDGLPITNYGFYTLLVEDQERQTKLIRVYVLPAAPVQ
ncbi:Ig-like domain repeat protein [Paenibacillus chartarius]|uniref:Ig-like domain repeat protein n=1 Tax=Paenibacillus chartarius TaxID=747481 RepID=A0ABV6DLQ7_9BACL